MEISDLDEERRSMYESDTAAIAGKLAESTVGLADLYGIRIEDVASHLISVYCDEVKKVLIHLAVSGK